MRSQNPTLRQTAGQDPRWYIRPYVDRLQADHSIKRVKERIYLGSCVEMTKRQAQAEAAKAMGMLNDRRRVVLAQINFGPFLDEYTERSAIRLNSSSFSSTNVRP